jgi:hypothetical protein
MKIAFNDIDGHTVRLTKEEIALCLQDMGNEAGSYMIVPNGYSGEIDEMTAFQIRARSKPNYWPWQRLSKWWNKSLLLDHTIYEYIQGKRLKCEVEGKSVWLKLKGEEPVSIEVRSTGAALRDEVLDAFRESKVFEEQDALKRTEMVNEVLSKH